MHVCGRKLPAYQLIMAVEPPQVIYHKVLFDPLLSTLRELTREGDELLMAHVRRWK